MMELAWMVRTWIQGEMARGKLLENLAGTLAGVTMAWGLLASLLESEEEFYLAADAWKPKDFAEQYASRCREFKERGVLACQSESWRLEAQCRQLIERTALPMNATEL